MRRRRRAVRALGAAARAVVWITREQWARLRAAEAGPTLSRSASRDLGDGIVLRDGRIALLSDAPVDTDDRACARPRAPPSCACRSSGPR